MSTGGQGLSARAFWRLRFGFQALFDAAAWFVGVFVATYLRYEMDFSKIDLGGVLVVGSIAALLQVVLGTLSGLYVHRWRYGTFEEIAATLRVVVGITVVLTLADISPVLDHAVPVSASIIAGFLALAGMSGGRLVWRLLQDRWTRATRGDREPVIVMGAGEGGLQTVTTMVKR